MTPLRIPNHTARTLWLTAHGLNTPQPNTPQPNTPLAQIHALGLVQLDTIQIVARAHHHILWSRNQTYREPMLNPLLKTRKIFEHFTHDASVLPMDFLPLWHRQFARMRAKLERSNWYGGPPDARLLNDIKSRISDEGPLSTHAFDTKLDGPREMWRRPPHKQALDYLWYSGELATSHRDGFTKVYDLAERVFPAHLRAQSLNDRDQIDGLCNAALTRLGFGTLTEIRKFWDATDAHEVADWAKRHTKSLIPVEIESADGTWTKALAAPDIEHRIQTLKAPTPRLRILNPFDPAIRDRTRLKRLFGFDYTVEMFKPAAKRQWGYYVFPLVEGIQFTGRLEAKADRPNETLTVLNHWPETKSDTQSPKSHRKKLDTELDRFKRLAALKTVTWVKT